MILKLLSPSNMFKCIELHVKAQTQRGREREREMEKKAIFVTHIQTSTSFPLTKSAPVSLSFQLFCVATQILKKDIYIYIHIYIYICKVVCKDHNQLSQVPPWHSSLPLRAKLLVLLKPYWLSSFGQLRSISNPFVVLFEFLRAASHWTYFPASVSRLPGKPLASQILQSHHSIPGFPDALLCTKSRVRTARETLTPAGVDPSANCLGSRWKAAKVDGSVDKPITIFPKFHVSTTQAGLKYLPN